MAYFDPDGCGACLDDWNILMCKYCNVKYNKKGNLTRHENDKHAQELKLLNTITKSNNSHYRLCTRCNIFVHVQQYEQHVTSNSYHLHQTAWNTANKRVCFLFFVFFFLFVQFIFVSNQIIICFYFSFI
jgi:hypothetical protein